MKISNVTIKGGRYYYIETLAERSKRTGRPRQQWHKLTRVDEGDQALLDALAAFKRGAPKRGDVKRRIDEFLAAWKIEQKPTAAVMSEYERMFGIVADDFEEFNVQQITPGIVLLFLRRFADHPTSRRSYKARLSTFFSWCVINGYASTNPCREIKIKAPPDRKRQIKDAGVWFAIYDRLPPIGQCFADLCFLTTARPTEIRLLDEAQIANGVIHFEPTKTARSSQATVDWPITPEIARVLDRARSLNKVRAMPGRSCPVIQDRDGARYTTAALREMWRSAAYPAGHRNVTTRDIRPYALVSAEQQGYDLRALQQAAAHTTSATTEGYLDQYRDVVSPVRMELPRRKG